MRLPIMEENGQNRHKQTGRPQKFQQSFPNLRFTMDFGYDILEKSVNIRTNDC